MLLDLSSNFKQYVLKGQNVLKVKSYSLLVNNAVAAGKVLAELEDVGISNVSISSTEYSKIDELLAILKINAIKKAKKNAEKLSQSLSQKAGKALFISDTNTITNALQGQVAGVKIRGYSSLYGNRAEEPIFSEFQKIKFEAQVHVKFQLD